MKPDKPNIAKAKEKFLKEGIVQDGIELSETEAVREARRSRISKMKTAKLKCDGVSRYRVQGRNNLTYSEAYDHIVSKFGKLNDKKCDKKPIILVRAVGLSKIRKLNEKHIKFLKSS